MRRHVALAALTLAIISTALAVIPTRPLPHNLRGPSDLPRTVMTDFGPMDVEHEYLPGVVDCELGWFTASPAALEAQAIAARTYLARHLDDSGLTARVPIGPAFQCWRRNRHPHSADAVARTNGTVLRLRNGRLLHANYVSGASMLGDECRALPPFFHGYPYLSWESVRAAYTDGTRFGGYAWTEIFVTDNHTGTDIRMTTQASADAENRGALGQYAAACFADQGLDSPTILRWFYGPDVELWAGQARLL